MTSVGTVRRLTLGPAFNNEPDAFVATYIKDTLTDLGRTIIEFYKDRASSFDIEFRIGQVGLDLMAG